MLWVVGVVPVESGGQINSKPDCLENGGRQTVPSKLEVVDVVVVGWGWTSVGLRRWYWGQFVEVEHDVEVLELEVDLREERGEEHCNIHAIGGESLEVCAAGHGIIGGSPQWADGEVVKEAFKGPPALMSSMIGFYNP